MKQKKEIKKTINPFIKMYPKLDLHGEITSTLKFIINDFINDNIKLQNEYIIIIHGKGRGLIKNKTYEILKQNKNVLSYHIDIFNEGATIVNLKVKN